MPKIDASNAISRIGRLKIQIGGLLMDLQELHLDRIPKKRFAELFPGTRADLEQLFVYRVARSEPERRELRRIEAELKKDVDELVNELKEIEGRINDLQESEISSKSIVASEILVASIDTLLSRAVSLRMFEHLPDRCDQ